MERLRVLFSINVATHLFSNRNLYVRLKEIVIQIYKNLNMFSYVKQKLSINLNVDNINVLLIVMIKYKQYKHCKTKSLEIQYRNNIFLRLNSPGLSVNVLFIKFNWVVIFSRIYFETFQIGFKITLFKMLRMKENIWMDNTCIPLCII